MLSRLKFKNFKSWPEADIEFGSITGLFGTNSSGKTSLIQFILLLMQTKDGTDRGISLDLNGTFVNLGVYHDIIHRNDENRVLSWSLAFELPRELSLIDPSGNRNELISKSNNLEISSEVSAVHQTISSTSLSYKLGDITFSLQPKSDQKKNFELKSSGDNFRFIRTLGRAWQLPGPIKSYAFPDQARTYFQNASFLSDIEAAYENQIDNLYYLGPLRDYPQRDYLWARSRPRDVGTRGEKAIDAILAATAADEKRNIQWKSRLKPFQEMIAFWLKEMGLIEDFQVEEIAKDSNRWQAKVRIRKEGTEALLTDVGFGVSQVLPVVTLLQYVPEGSTVILEQPEIHLHPLAQANLADVIINAAIHRKVQVILESHSEHLLLRLQRRVAERMISSDDIKLYFCDSPRGTSKLDLLQLDLLGQISNWPNNFMGDAFGETYEAEKARLKYMIEEKSKT
jgi:predicted ATPase